MAFRLHFRSARILGETTTHLGYGTQSVTTYDLSGAQRHAIQGRWWRWVALLSFLCALVFGIVLTMFALLVVTRSSGAATSQAEFEMRRYCETREIRFVSSPQFAVPEEEWARLPAAQRQAGKDELARLARAREDGKRRELRIILLTGLVCYVLALPLGLLAALEFVRTWIVAADRGLAGTPAASRPKFKEVWERNWEKFEKKLNIRYR